jgi:hypothetical protein
MKVVGLFIEPRKLKQIYYNIDNFFDVLPDCKLYFYCGKGLLQHYDKLKQKYKLLIIRELNTYNLDALTYSDFMKTKSLWESLDGEYCLTIQTDGCLCKNSDYKIEDFFKYDYIGSYIYLKYRFRFPFNFFSMRNTTGEFSNGGFSFRKISTMLHIISIYKPVTTYKAASFEGIVEDMYFYKGCKKLNYNCANDNFAFNFSTQALHLENIKVFCIHKISYNSNEIIKYCPEYNYFISPIKEIKNSITITPEEILYSKRKINSKRLLKYIIYICKINMFILLFSYVVINIWF